MKEFNVTGVCVPEKNYMVDTTEKLNQMITLIEKEKYFTINCGRQYGKTTTLASLYRSLKEKYMILRLSFEGVGEESFADSRAFVEMFIDAVADFLEFIEEDESLIKEWKDCSGFVDNPYKDSFDILSKKITRLCKQSGREILLFVDEVDKSSDNQIFLNFLGMLRNKYLRRQEGLDESFKSVVLAGVYDVKNLKIKLRTEEEKKYNSPWNVAVDFNVDMSFSPKEIATMLTAYESDHHTGMDIKQISGEIYSYTSGYPYLVSWLCKWMDETKGAKWEITSIHKAIKELLNSRNCTLLDDLKKNVENNQELKRMIMNMLCEGRQYTFSLANPVIEMGVMFAIFTRKGEELAISNKIFELYLYNYSISIRETREDKYFPLRSQFIENGFLNMELVLRKFQEIMKSEYRKEDEKFVEQQGRLLFLCFLKPIINGTGFYYVEPETRNSERMDVVVSYGGEEFIIELKIWHGSEYRKKGIRQLEEYMDSRNAEKGYLVSFSFQKDKKYKAEWIQTGETTKEIFEVVV